MDKQFLKDIAPYLGPYIIVLGVLKLHAYYSCFGINVLQYLEPSEVILAFVPSFLQIFVILGIWVVATILIYWLTPNVIRELFHERGIALWALAIVFALNIVATYSYFLQRENIFSKTIAISLLIVLQGAILATYLRTGRRRKDFLVSATAIIAAVFFYLGGFDNAVQAKGLPRPKVCIYYTDKTDLQTGDSISYLGKTKNFLFFFNWKEKRPEVVSASKLDRIEGFSDYVPTLWKAW